MVISGLEAQEARVASAYGIDLHFLNRANFLKKRVIQLETREFQAGLFKEFSAVQQELYLLDTVKNLSRAASNVSALLRAWREGDTKTLEDFSYGSSAGDPQISPIRDKILTARNRTILVKIQLNVGSKKKGQALPYLAFYKPDRIAISSDVICS